MTEPIKITLKMLRVGAGLTQAQCAEKVGVDPKTWGFWESGKSLPKLDKAMKICKMFDIKLSELVFILTKLTV